MSHRSARPSSALQIELFHASWLLDKSLGKLTARISDLIEAGGKDLEFALS
jgi:hypothetical protein